MRVWENLESVATASLEKGGAQFFALDMVSCKIVVNLLNTMIKYPIILSPKMSDTSEKNFGVGEPALVLTEGTPSHQDRCLAKVLQFFGVASRNLTVAEFQCANTSGTESSARSRILCSAQAFLQLIQEFECNPDNTPSWWRHLHSAFVYAGDDFEVLQKLARIFTGDDSAMLEEIDSSGTDLVVSEHLNDFCGAMAGIRVAVSRANVAGSRVLHISKGNATSIISLDQGAMFLRIEYKGVVICLSTSKRILNIDAKPGSRNFDVRDHFLSAVPIVLYVKWAFADICWQAPEINACLMIDDPLLKPSYGCMDFKQLLALMERYHFSTNIAFIPWNWRRSKPKVIALFTQRPDCYSLSIHGSDHIAREFGTSDRNCLRWKATEAIDRMSGHQGLTGIPYDRVMVFPQGIFSKAAMDVLKRCNFTAAVNSEILSTDHPPHAIRISDVWDIAVMRYACFPMFTRRDPIQGIENFAFDVLLGKPCLVALHHNFCRHRYKHLIDFINRLKALNCRLSWRSLGEVVKRSYRQRELSPNRSEVEMYAAELILENSSDQPKQFLVRRPENDPSAIKEICDGPLPVTWHSSNGYINFEIESAPHETKGISVRFHEPVTNGYAGGDRLYRFRTMVRRYLSEARDNHFTKRSMRFLP